MQRLLLIAAFAVACRQSDGATQGASNTTPAAATPAPPPATASNASGGSQGSDSARDNATLERADAARIQGAKNAPVWFIEISDFQCPYCKQFHDSIYPAIKKQYVDAGIVRMAYLNLPLSSIHMNAEPAAEAAMCAAAQDKFWPMHDRLFDTQDRWKNDPKPARLMDSLAVAVGADGATWRACMAGGLMKRIVSGDRARAAASGARSTPTFFIGDERFAGLAPSATETIGAFKRAIERERAKKAGRPTP